jgi:hypothetical protein
MNGSVRPDEAASALAEIQHRHQQAVEVAFLPAWYWWAVGALNIGFAATLDVRRPVVTGVGVAAYVIGMVAVNAYVLRGVLRAPLRRDLYGPTEVLSIVSFVALAVGVSLGVGFALDAVGVRYPAATGMVAGMVLFVIGGPLLTRYLRRSIAGKPGKPGKLGKPGKY